MPTTDRVDAQYMLLALVRFSTSVLLTWGQGDFLVLGVFYALWDVG